MGEAAMERYSNEELSEMAMEFLEDLSVGGAKSFGLVITMSVAIDMEPERVVDEICKLVIR